MDNKFKDLFDKISSHLLNDEKPSCYLKILENPIFNKYPFCMISSLKDVEQSPVYHSREMF